MKTKNIIKALAFVILVPAMLLNTACSSEITNIEDTDAKGYTLPVTVNVTRQGDDPATKATYNASSRTLEFSTGDKLFVNGKHTTAGQFAGTLTWTSGGTFSGTITTQHEWTDTADALFTAATKINAYLLPDGYESIGFLTIIPWTSAEYDDDISTVNSNAFALTLAAGIEQLSLESANAYSSGFALTPVNAILNFTISGLTASTEVAVVFSDSHDTVDKKVTTDASGNAKFVVGVLGTGAYTDIQNCTLTVGGKTIALASGSKTLIKGTIYNITRSAAPAPAATDLSTISEAYTASDGETLTGTLGANVKISIADGATVTLDGVSINASGSWTTGNYAGITCVGTATIILNGTNTVKGFYDEYPGIQAAAGKTLTIKGSGSLTASSNGWGAGIGGGWEIDCGNIEIQGGTITATGGTGCAGIGAGNGGYNVASCGTITISGGTITATGGEAAAGIGSGTKSSCGNITITSGVTHVTATKGEGANSIGAGVNGTCGTVTIEDESKVTKN